MRTEIQPQVNTYYESRKASHTLVSDESGQPWLPTTRTFPTSAARASTTSRWSSSRPCGGFDVVALTSETARGLALFTDRTLAERWHAHHQEHAVLGLLWAKENLRRLRGC